MARYGTTLRPNTLKQEARRQGMQTFLVLFCLTCLVATLTYQPLVPAASAATNGDRDCSGDGSGGGGGDGSGPPCPGNNIVDDCECLVAGVVYALLDGPVQPSPAALGETVSASLDGSGVAPSTSGNCDLSDVVWDWAVASVEHRLESTDPWLASAYFPAINHPDRSSPIATLEAAPPDPGYWRVTLRLKAVWACLEDCAGDGDVVIEFPVVGGSVEGELTSPESVNVFASARSAAEVVVYPAEFASACVLRAEGTALTFEGGALEYNLTGSPELVDVIGTAGSGELSGELQLVLTRSSSAAFPSGPGALSASSAQPGEIGGEAPMSPLDAGGEGGKEGGGEDGVDEEAVLDDAATRKFDHFKWYEGLINAAEERVDADDIYTLAVDFTIGQMNDQFDSSNPESLLAQAIESGDPDAISDATAITNNWNSMLTTTRADTRSYLKSAFQGLFEGGPEANDFFTIDFTSRPGYAAGERYPAATNLLSFELDPKVDLDYSGLIFGQILAGEDVADITDYVTTPGTFVKGVDLFELKYEYADGRGTSFAFTNTLGLNWETADEAGQPGKWEEPDVTLGVGLQYRFLQFRTHGLQIGVSVDAETEAVWDTDEDDVEIGEPTVGINLEIRF